MARGRNKKEGGGRPAARAAAKPTIYKVREAMELMEFLMLKMDGISRTRVKTLLANRVISVDNQIITQYNYQLRSGMEVQMSKAKNNREFKHNMVKLVYEDAYILVIEKKDGLLSVSNDKQKERTAQNILNEYVKRKHKSNRVFVVHRLDRGTSGLMMYAKDEKTQHKLRDNWQEIVTDRRYVAIVAGDMEQDAGTYESWLTDRKTFVTSSPYDDGEGKYAVTHYKTIKRANGYSMMELDLETGRKNQIRVHMSELGHPVLGDERYRSIENPLGRLALHAFKLAFYHPVTNQIMTFETPYPSGFKNLMLRKPQATTATAAPVVALPTEEEVPYRAELAAAVAPKSSKPKRAASAAVVEEEDAPPAWSQEIDE